MLNIGAARILDPLLQRANKFNVNLHPIPQPMIMSLGLIQQIAPCIAHVIGMSTNEELTSGYVAVILPLNAVQSS